MLNPETSQTLPSKPTLSTWEVYIIETKSGKLYTGITSDLNRRFQEHKTMKKGARFFHIESPKSVVFREAHPNRSSATKKEIEIKSMSRDQKLSLIQATKERGARG